MIRSTDYLRRSFILARFLWVLIKSLTDIHELCAMATFSSFVSIVSYFSLTGDRRPMPEPVETGGTLPSLRYKPETRPLSGDSSNTGEYKGLSWVSNASCRPVLSSNNDYSYWGSIITLSVPSANASCTVLPINSYVSPVLLGSREGNWRFFGQCLGVFIVSVKIGLLSERVFWFLSFSSSLFAYVMLLR